VREAQHFRIVFKTGCAEFNRAVKPHWRRDKHPVTSQERFQRKMACDLDDPSGNPRTGDGKVIKLYFLPFADCDEMISRSTVGRKSFAYADRNPDCAVGW